MLFPYTTRNLTSHEQRQMDIARPHSAPAALERWQRHDFAWSDAASYDYIISPEIDEEHQHDETNGKQAGLQYDYEYWFDVSLQDMTHGFIVCSHKLCEALVLSRLYDDVVKTHKCAECEEERFISRGHRDETSIANDHARLAQYSRELSCMMQEAMDRLIADGGMEPFPAYTEEDYI